MHQMYSMLYAANLGFCDYVLYSQIWSQTCGKGNQVIKLNLSSYLPLKITMPAVGGAGQDHVLT